MFFEYGLILNTDTCLQNSNGLSNVPDVDHSLGLIDLMQVEQFIQIDKDIWVPAKAISYNVASSGEMKLDENRSSFNSITSGELFSGKSLPEVNREDDGWKQYLPPAELAKAAAFGDFQKPGFSGFRARVIASHF